MIDRKLEQQIRQASLSDKLQIIEIALQFLKQELSQENVSSKVPPKKFQIRKFHLGKVISFNRDEIYSERILLK